jgi:hypothetical protein
MMGNHEEHEGHECSRDVFVQEEQPEIKPALISGFPLCPSWSLALTQGSLELRPRDAADAHDLIAVLLSGQDNDR